MNIYFREGSRVCHGSVINVIVMHQPVTRTRSLETRGNHVNNNNVNNNNANNNNVNNTNTSHRSRSYSAHRPLTNSQSLVASRVNAFNHVSGNDEVSGNEGHVTANNSHVTATSHVTTSSNLPPKSPGLHASQNPARDYFHGSPSTNTPKSSHSSLRATQSVSIPSRPSSRDMTVSRDIPPRPSSRDFTVSRDIPSRPSSRDFTVTHDIPPRPKSRDFTANSRPLSRDMMQNTSHENMSSRDCLLSPPQRTYPPSTPTRTSAANVFTFESREHQPHNYHEATTTSSNYHEATATTNNYSSSCSSNRPREGLNLWSGSRSEPTTPKLASPESVVSRVTNSSSHDTMTSSSRDLPSSVDGVPQIIIPSRDSPFFHQRSLLGHFATRRNTSNPSHLQNITEDWRAGAQTSSHPASPYFCKPTVSSGGPAFRRLNPMAPVYNPEPYHRANAVQHHHQQHHKQHQQQKHNQQQQHNQQRHKQQQHPTNKSLMSPTIPLMTSSVSSPSASHRGLVSSLSTSSLAEYHTALRRNSLLFESSSHNDVTRSHNDVICSHNDVARSRNGIRRSQSEVRRPYDDGIHSADSSIFLDPLASPGPARSVKSEPNSSDSRDRHMTSPPSNHDVTSAQQHDLSPTSPRNQKNSFESGYSSSGSSTSGKGGGLGRRRTIRPADYRDSSSDYRSCPYDYRNSAPTTPADYKPTVPSNTTGGLDFVKGNEMVSRINKGYDLGVGKRSKLSITARIVGGQRRHKITIYGNGL